MIPKDGSIIYRVVLWNDIALEDIEVERFFVRKVEAVSASGTRLKLQRFNARGFYGETESPVIGQRGLYHFYATEREALKVIYDFLRKREKALHKEWEETNARVDELCEQLHHSEKTS